MKMYGFQVELFSGKEVADIIPDIPEIKKCSSRGVLITGPAPAGSGYDFFTRFFCPKFGVNEVRPLEFVNLLWPIRQFIVKYAYEIVL
jgi:hypothetical protein